MRWQQPRRRARGSSVATRYDGFSPHHRHQPQRGGELALIPTTPRSACGGQRRLQRLPTSGCRADGHARHLTSVIWRRQHPLLGELEGKRTVDRLPVVSAANWWGWCAAPANAFVHADTSAGREIVSNTAKAIVWRASNFAFNRQVTQDGIGGLNLGFPWPVLRCGNQPLVQPQPLLRARFGYGKAGITPRAIRLLGGTNTYGYVRGNSPIESVWAL